MGNETPRFWVAFGILLLSFAFATFMSLCMVTAAHAEAVPSAPKLNAEIVRSIRDGFQDGVGQTQLARRYGVDPSTITSVVRRQTWAHIA